MRIKDTKDLRTSNTFRVLNVLRENGKSTRSELATFTHLNKGTITNITKVLLSKSLIVEGESLESSGGRRPIVLSLNDSLGYCIAIDLRLETIDILKISLSGEVLYETSITMVAESSAKMIQMIIDTIHSIVSESNATKLGLCGITVSVNGVVSLDGNIAFIPQLQWHNIDLKGILEKEFNVFTLIDSTGNFRALAELNTYSQYKDIISVNIDSNISCGIVTNGELVKGFLGYANTIGHQIINYHEDESCSCGRKGCWEQYSSITSLLKNYNKISGKNISSLDDFIYLVQLKDKNAINTIQKFIKNLVIGLENIIFIFNCECIILSGQIFNNLPYLINEINKNMTLPITHYQNIIISKLGNQVAIKGAASMCIEHFFKEYIKNLNNN